MVPKATVKVFGEMFEAHARKFLKSFPSHKRTFDAIAVLLRDEPDIYVHLLFVWVRGAENLRRVWGVDRADDDLSVLMSEMWQKQYISHAREDLAGRTVEDRIPPKTLRAFEEALECLVRDYPVAEHSLDLLRAEPEVCIHALFVAMRQKQVNDGVQWYEFYCVAHPREVEKARQDLLEEVSA